MTTPDNGATFFRRTRPAVLAVFTLILTPVPFTFRRGFEKHWRRLLIRLPVPAPSEGVKDG